MRPRALQWLVPAVLAAVIAPASASETLSPSGPFVEPATGMRFPEAIGDFQRDHITKFAPDGSDESAGYNIVTPGNEITMTVYVFPSPPLTSIGSPQSVIDSARAHLCEEQFHGIEQEIAGYHPGAEFLGEEPATLTRLGTDFAGHKASYRLTDMPWFGRSEVTRSDAYVFCYAGGKWTVEYRIDHPIDKDADAAIADFMRDLAWTMPPE